MVAAPLVSIVIPVLHDAEELERLLAELQRPPLSGDAKDSVLAAAQTLEWDRDPNYQPERVPDEPSLQRGMEVFRDQCASCHKRGGRDAPVPLALTTTVNAPDPRNVIHIVFDGIRPPRGALQRSMPEFGASIADSDIVDLLHYIRWHFTDQPAWEDVAGHVAAKRAVW